MSHYNVSFKYGIFLVVFLLLSGCAAMGLVKFDKAANTHIKKIALLRVDEPKIIIRGVTKWHSLITTGGTVWGIPTTPYLERTAKDWNCELLGTTMARALRQELTKIGYDFIYLEYQSIMKSGVRDIQTDADAILFVHLCAGYACQSKKKGFKPSVFAAVRLYDSRSKKVIYSRNIDVGEGSRASRPNVTFIPPDEKYTYNSFDAVKKNFDEAVQGITDCQNKIAARIAEHLK